jgi:hypothetical protein
MALNVFFRNNASTVTNVHSLGKEDFHHGNTEEPVRITLTFKDLSVDAQKELAAYYRQNRLTVTAKAVWNSESESAEVKQYGERLVMSDFAPYFKGAEEGQPAAELKKVFDVIRKAYPEVASATSGPTREQALRDFEEAHPELCTPHESAHQFFGFTKGSNILQKYIQWVYVPAVKDASTEQDEGSKTALGQLLERTVRTRVKFKEAFDTLKKSLEVQYRAIIELQENSLADIQESMERRLREWASPNAKLQLTWHYDSAKSIVVNEPLARAQIGEDNFIGEIARLGHGMQRSFLVALLHELAMSSGGGGPTLILGMEEPELYQHPSQALHIANVLEELAETPETNSQVIISTHSPHFISAKGFENVRVVRKHAIDKCSLVSSTTFNKFEEVIAKAVNGKPDLPSVVMTSIEQIMQPSQRELYFTRFAILLEGIEDVAFIGTHLKLTNRWLEFRKNGCHFIISVGKTNLSRPVVIAQQLCIPHFAVFDADGNSSENRDGHKRDNDCLFKLFGQIDAPSFPESIVWGDCFTCWPSCIFDAVKDDFGENVWNQATEKAKVNKGYVKGVKQKNNMLIAATLEELSKEGKHSAVLTQLCDRILTKASESRLDGAIA